MTYQITKYHFISTCLKVLSIISILSLTIPSRDMGDFVVYPQLFAQSQSQAKIEGKIAVLQILNQSTLKPEEINFLTNEIQSKVQIKTRGYYQVMTQENILQLLPPDKKLEDCVGECEVETGRLLGAKLLITGTLVKFGNQKDDLRLSLKLHETANGTLIASSTVKGSNANDIEEKLNQATENLISDGLRILKAQEFDGQLANTNQANPNQANPNQANPNQTNSDDLSRKLDELNQLGQKNDDAQQTQNIDYESELQALEAQKQKKEAHIKQVETQWKQVLNVKANGKVAISIQAVQIFINQYNQHPLGNHRFKEAVALLDELKAKEEQEKKDALDKAHLNKVRISYEAAKKYIANGDEKGKKALDLFLKEFDEHTLGNPLKDEAIQFYETKKRERDDAEKEKHLIAVQKDWDKAKKIVEGGDEKAQKALELFLDKYKAHPLGNPLADEAQTFFDEKKRDRENRLMMEHQKTVETEWGRIRKVVGVGGNTAVRTVELFLKKYEKHPLGNPLEADARDVLADLKAGKEIQGEGNGGSMAGKGKAGIEWIRIWGGSFMMGSKDGDSDEQPVHRVVVKDFYMSKTEVTVGQYRKCVEAGVCSEPTDKNDNSYCNWGYSDREDHPINCVDWKQARTFAKWVGGDLPSEAQWEYASRSGGKDIKYPWGNAEATCKYAVMTDRGEGCGRDRTWEVCSTIDGNTAQGVCDMGGNVSEWVLDEYHGSYNGAPTDGRGWCSDMECSSNTSIGRLARGGCWYDVTSYLRSASRPAPTPSYRDRGLGFRVSRYVP